MSQTYIATIVGALAIFLPKFGLTIGSDELTAIISNTITVISGIWVIVRRYQLGKQITPGGDINIAGVRKN